MKAAYNNIDIHITMYVYHQLFCTTSLSVGPLKQGLAEEDHDSEKSALNTSGSYEYHYSPE